METVEKLGVKANIKKIIELYVNACGPCSLSGCRIELRTQCIGWYELSYMDKDILFSDAINELIRENRVELDIDISRGMEITIDQYTVS